ncbi:PAS domain S-box protein [Desulfoplanes sp.]
MDAFSFYTEALARSSDCGLIFDRQGTLLYINPPLSSLYGVEPGQGVGRSIYGFLDPGEVDRAREIVARLFNGTHLGDYRFKFKGAGEKQGVPTFVHWRVQEVYTRDGRENFVLALGRPDRNLGENLEYKEEMNYFIGMDGEIIDIHPGICAMCGYTRREVMAMNTSDFYFNPGDKRRIMRRLKGDGEIVNDQVTLRCKDGTPRTFKFNSHIVSRQGRPVVAGYFVQREVTYTRKLIHDFSKIIDALPDIAWVAGYDHSIVCANDAYCSFIGVRSQDHLTGRTVFDFMPESKGRSVIQTATTVFEQRREIIIPMLSHFQNPGVWYRAIHTPIFDDTHREVIGLLGIYQDISPQVAKENDYLDEIGSTNGAVFVLDTQCRIIRRRGRVLRPGAAPVDSDRYRHLDLKIVFEIIHPQDLERAQGFIKRIVQTKTPHQGEFRVRRTSREYALMEVRGVYSDAYFPEGRIYVAVRDISHLGDLRRPGQVLERLKQATGTTTNKDLAAFLGVSPTSISNAIKNQKIPADWMMGVGLETGFSVDWLVTGKGGRRRGDIDGGDIVCPGSKS